jgi:hypothetical protein
MYWIFTTFYNDLVNVSKSCENWEKNFVTNISAFE